MSDWQDISTAVDQCGYHKAERIPAIRHGDSFTNHHRLPNGAIGERVTEAEATHFLVHHFHIEAAPPVQP